MNRLAAFAPQILALQRIIVGLLFLEHGTSKLFGFPESPMPMPDPLTPMLLASAVLELIGGALLADAAFRAARSEVAVFALIVDAKDDAAAAFYRHHGFEPIGDSGRQLIVALKRFTQIAG